MSLVFCLPRLHWLSTTCTRALLLGMLPPHLSPTRRSELQADRDQKRRNDGTRHHRHPTSLHLNTPRSSYLRSRSTGRFLCSADARGLLPGQTLLCPTGVTPLRKLPGLLISLLMRRRTCRSTVCALDDVMRILRRVGTPGNARKREWNNRLGKQSSRRRRSRSRTSGSCSGSFLSPVRSEFEQRIQYYALSFSSHSCSPRAASTAADCALLQLLEQARRGSSTTTREERQQEARLTASVMADSKLYLRREAKGSVSHSRAAEGGSRVGSWRTFGGTGVILPCIVS